MENLYKLRTDFAIIGLTGRSGAGCSHIAKQLSDPDYIRKIKLGKLDGNDAEDLKLKICKQFLEYGDNWKSFKVIKYSSVLIYHLLHESCLHKSFEDSKIRIVDIIVSSLPKGSEYRFEGNEEATIISIIDEIFTKDVYNVFKQHSCNKLNDCLKEPDYDLVAIFWNNITPFSDQLLDELKQISYPKTAVLIQNLACNLRSFESVSCIGKSNIDNSYTVAETINRIIKEFRKSEDEFGKKIGHGRIVIDSLKNSIELIYFKEKYSGFYCIATNKLQKEAEEYKQSVFTQKFGFKTNDWLSFNKDFDKTEYKGKEVNDGEFSSPDIENCIQKSDFHIFWSKSYETYKDLLLGEDERSVNLDRQLVKFISLLFVPGIITPSPMERNMQIAFNAKANSGCISRQVGAVITDESFSVKAIGWNDVARFQVPCNLRNIYDLTEGANNQNHFSDFEKGLGDKYLDGQSFKEKMNNLKGDIDPEKLNGRNCSFCFKSCHNAFEGKENQVHTRSLHAEENAMLQITKYGGQGVKNGFLFTTASPCELCSKKAFQLGIKTIYYIDPYPGIAGDHILTGSKEKGNNPLVRMFRGAVGRAYHKLYEPFMNYKDELFIRTGVKPETDKHHFISKLTSDPEKQSEIYEILRK
jgi:deoxycytidylate deaminase